MRKKFKPKYLILVLTGMFLVLASTAMFTHLRLPDDMLARQIMKNASRHETRRAVFWIEKGYLSGEETAAFMRRVGEGIGRTEEYLDRKFDANHYLEGKIHFFVKSGRLPSHVYGGFEHPRYRKPYVFLAYVKGETAPYLRETVHVIAWETYAPWLREGLGVHLNDKLGGWPAFPNFGADIDARARSYVRDPLLKDYVERILATIGQNSIPAYPSRDDREAFFVLTGSFVKYLEEQMGIRRLMTVYRAKDPRRAIREATGRSIDDWKKSWLSALRTSA